MRVIDEGYMGVSLNYCSQNGGNVYRAPYYREFRPIPIYKGYAGAVLGFYIRAILGAN